MNEEIFVLDEVYKNFPSPVKGKELKVLEDISLKIYEGEIVALLGPSGCGKSTILNLGAGFESPDKGKVTFLGLHISEPSPQRSVVFQSAVLLPWLTVRENIEYGLKIKKWDDLSIAKICEEYIKLVKLEGFQDYYPHQLSGGMQQRVALARVLVLKPRMLLMDEPFAALDAQTRLYMQQLLQSISIKLNPSVLFVTHDVEEALLLADRIYIMSSLPGRIIGEIPVAYKKPRGISLLGNPEFARAKGEILQLLLDGQSLT